MNNRPNFFFTYIFLFLAVVFSECSSSRQTGKTRFEEGKEASPNTTAESYYQPQRLRYSNHIYQDHIKTVRLHRKGWELSRPILRMNTDDELVLSFDDLKGGYIDYSYTLIHCNADWTPTDLPKSEYLTGYHDDQITDQEYSVNTVQQYSHYRLMVPNEEISLKLSGNYLLKVYEEESGNLILTHRLMVVDDRMEFDGKVSQPRGFDDMEKYQEIDFTMEPKNMDIQNPFRDIKTIIIQNQRWDNAIKGIKPRFVKGNKLIYDYDDGTNRFPGGNEFRKFNLQSMRYQTQEIKTIEYDSSQQYHVYLEDDERRIYHEYFSESDINGQYTIKTNDNPNDATGADYVYVHFSLPLPNSFPNGNLYVFGGLSNWRCRKEQMLYYDKDEKRYKATLYLKQGYYNYQYAFLEDKSDHADLPFIEGTHFDTENNYTILVYYQNMSRNYDQLIGTCYLNSRKD